MAKLETKPIPLWGWPILLLGTLLSGRLLSLGGAEFVLNSASWSNALMWGLSAGICLGASLWLSRVRSPEYALVLAGLFFLFISVQSQMDYLSGSKSWLYHQIHHVDDNPWPGEWRELKRDGLYEAFIADQVDPIGVFWLDHMRAQASIGVQTFEKEGHRRYGGTSIVEVYRQGFWMWWGWFCCYLILAAGCFAGTFGAAIVEDQLPDEIDIPSNVKKDIIHKLKGKGLTKQEINQILTRPTRRSDPIKKIAVESLLPKDVLLVEKIAHDLQLAKNWITDCELERILSEDDAKHLHSLNEHFYADQAVAKLQPWHLYLLAADRLNNQYPGEYFFDSLITISNITSLLEIHYPLPPFAYIDLTGINFKKLSCGQEWRPLFGRGGNFYDWNSPWEKLQALRVEEIPEDAHLAIIYQMRHQPNARTYEMWQGVTPSDLMEQMAPKMRNAILTYINHSHQWFPSDKSNRLDSLAAYASQWPRDQAEEFLLRCVHAGWLGAFKQLAKRHSWQGFLDSHSPAPFGNFDSPVH